MVEIASTNPILLLIMNFNYTRIEDISDISVSVISEFTVHKLSWGSVRIADRIGLPQMFVGN